MTTNRPTTVARDHAVAAGQAGAPVAPPQRVGYADAALVTTDAGLTAALRSVAPNVSIMTATSPSALADLLLSGHCGVLVVDVPALGRDAVATLTDLGHQFPDIPIVAVGTRADQALLGALISSGQVYRYLHRPLSAARARTFLEVALRRHAQRAPAMHPPSRSHATGPFTAQNDPTLRPAAGPRSWPPMPAAHRKPALLLACAIALLAIALFAWLAPHDGAWLQAPGASGAGYATGSSHTTVRGALREAPAAAPAEPEPVITVAASAPRGRSAGAGAGAPDALTAAPVTPVAPVAPEVAEWGPVTLPTADAPPPVEEYPDADVAPAAETATPAPPTASAPLVQLIRVPPVYPIEARQRGTEGWVTVRFTVTPQGGTDNVRVTAASPRGLFEPAVIAAVQRWRYAPRPTPSEVEQRLVFRLR